MNKSAVIFGVILILSLVAIGIASAQVSYCCEKTLDTNPSEDINNAAWCMDAPQEYCDTNYQMQQGSCQATDYCKRGTCVVVTEGECRENVPESLCENPPEGAEGIWYDQPMEDLQQCGKGCCIMGEQVAFVTQTRCTSLSALYGGESVFRTDITNQLECFANSGRSSKGACVLETDTGRTCKFGTKGDCIDTWNGEFHENLLCTNDNLNTGCAPTTNRECVEGKDEVYFVDSCGNIANIYDAARTADKDIDYWQEIMLPNCANADGTINPSTCGDCGYSSSGTTCVNKVCKSLDCEDSEFRARFGRDPVHGETWCAGGTNTGISGANLTFKDLTKTKNLPGSRDVRMVCYNGEVTPEPCYDQRQEVCIEGNSGNDVKSGNCEVNRWVDCSLQNNKADCTDSELRDCVWVSGVSFFADDNGKELVEDADGNLVSPGDEGGIGAACVPKYTPGFIFWEQGTGDDVCGIANRKCIVQYQKGVVGKWKVKGDILCLNDEGKLVKTWTDEINNVCASLGDCGISANYVNGAGYNDVNDLFTVIGEPGEEEEE